ncbi:MAG: hypothetical protein JWR16_3614 [Nevskia sp.]|nr:hypothetical protein [Nevskia sp.]
MNTMRPSEDELHAYVDQQLDPQRRAAMESFLAASPEDAARVAAWRRDADALRTALAGTMSLPMNPAFDPAAIRRRMRMRTTRRWSMAASFVLVMGLSGMGGWFAHNTVMNRAAPPMQDAVDAYRVFATDSVHPVEWRPDANGGSDSGGDLQTWLGARLGRPMSLPDLGAYGFKLMGGRLLSTDDGPAALILYEDAAGQRVSFYLRPSSRTAPGTQGQRTDKGLQTRYWFRNGYGFAVVGRSSDPRTTEIQDAFPSAT